MSYITSKDVVSRIKRRKPYWAHGKPNVMVERTNDGWGYIVLDFYDGHPLNWRIYMPSELEKDKIEDIIEMALLNYYELCWEIDEEKYG